MKLILLLLSLCLITSEAYSDVATKGEWITPDEKISLDHSKFKSEISVRCHSHEFDLYWSGTAEFSGVDDFAVWLWRGNRLLQECQFAKFCNLTDSIVNDKNKFGTNSYPFTVYLCPRYEQIPSSLFILTTDRRFCDALDFMLLIFCVVIFSLLVMGLWRRFIEPTVFSKPNRKNK